jgi:hypothetical protein
LSFYFSGTLEGNAFLTVMATGGYEKKDILSTERYKLGLVYAGQPLQWHVLFDLQEPESPPQFLFPTSPSFLQDLSLDELEMVVPSLVNWNSDDDRALVKVVNEMIMVYRTLQVKAVKTRQNSRHVFLLLAWPKIIKALRVAAYSSHFLNIKFLALKLF